MGAVSQFTVGFVSTGYGSRQLQSILNIRVDGRISMARPSARLSNAPTSEIRHTCSWFRFEFNLSDKVTVASVSPINP
jgi:hypothetical protein